MSSPLEWKRFVRGSSSSSCNGDNLEDLDSLAAPRADKDTDTDAQRSYEEIIGADAKRPVLRTPPAPSVPAAAPNPPPPPPQYSLSSLMKFAECNDYKKITVAVNSDSSIINSVDQFGWSLLMVAACAGARQVVESLLLAGANVELRDRAGYSCKSLARRKGHHDIFDLIKNFKHPVTEVEEIVEEVDKPVILELCASCNMRIAENRKKSHLTSTVHQFSQCKNGCRTFYSIPGSNRGYQLMLKSGWDGERGLGPSGKGAKMPPKTTLKRDRKGLGSSKAPARITHFQSHDYEAVSTKPREKPLNKTQRNHELQRDKLVEICLRRELS